jgi:hypothetical protein
MRLKNALFIVVIFITSNNLLAQKWNKSIKIYNQTTFYKKTVLQGTTVSGNFTTESTHKAIQHLEPTIAFQWKSKENKWGHEVELTTLESRKVDFEEVTTNTSTKETIAGYRSYYGSIVMRYEIKRYWKIDRIKNLTLELGSGGQPFFYWNRTTPKTSQSFPTSLNYSGINILLTPSVVYNISDKWFLNINLPYNLATVSWTNQKVLNSAFSAAQQKTNSLDFKTMDRNVHTRIGFGVKI